MTQTSASALLNLFAQAGSSAANVAQFVLTKDLAALSDKTGTNLIVVDAMQRTAPQELHSASYLLFDCLSEKIVTTIMTFDEIERFLGLVEILIQDGLVKPEELFSDVFGIETKKEEDGDDEEGEKELDPFFIVPDDVFIDILR